MRKRFCENKLLILTLLGVMVGALTGKGSEIDNTISYLI